MEEQDRELEHYERKVIQNLEENSRIGGWYRVRAGEGIDKGDGAGAWVWEATITARPAFKRWRKKRQKH
jgi:hypothetical protein